MEHKNCTLASTFAISSPPISIQTQSFYCWGIFFNQICFHLCFIYLQKFIAIPHEIFYERFLQHVKQCDVIGFVFAKHLEEFLRTALGITVFEDMERTLHLRVLMVEGNDLDASNMTYRCLTDNSNKKLRRPDKVDDDIHFINFQPYIKLAFRASCQ